MSRNKKTGVFILFLLLSVVYLQAAFPGVFTIFPRQGQLKISQNTSSSLQNDSSIGQTTKIMIDPGHGGTDSGVDKGHIIESEVALDISKKLKTYLEDKSFIVEMTRSTDISLYKLSSIAGTLQRRELDARTNIINESGAKIFVSIHVNSYPEYPNMSGSIVYYNPLMPQSKELSSCIQKQLNGINVVNFKRDTHNTQEADFYLLKSSNIPGVLVETAFMTNQNERKLLSQDDFRSQIAKAVADGTDNYLYKK